MSDSLISIRPFTSDNRSNHTAFICQRCGHPDNADHNAACVIAKRGIQTLLSGDPLNKQHKPTRIFRKRGPEQSEVTPGDDRIRRGTPKAPAQWSGVRWQDKNTLASSTAATRWTPPPGFAWEGNARALCSIQPGLRTLNAAWMNVIDPLPAEYCARAKGPRVANRFRMTSAQTPSLSSIAIRERYSFRGPLENHRRVIRTAIPGTLKKRMLGPGNDRPCFNEALRFSPSSHPWIRPSSPTYATASPEMCHGNPKRRKSFTVR